MSSVSHQTVKLSRGKHESPEKGACVMELASMLAGERFSDHPQSVCPVIGAFLRAYNDSLGDGPRQDLYDYASKIVGSRAPQPVQRARLERLVCWAEQRRGHPRTRRFALAWLRPALMIPKPSVDATITDIVRSIKPTDKLHSEILALIDELLDIGNHELKQTRDRDRFTSLPPRAARL